MNGANVLFSSIVGGGSATHTGRDLCLRWRLAAGDSELKKMAQAVNETVESGEVVEVEKIGGQTASSSLTAGRTNWSALTAQHWNLSLFQCMP